MNLKKRIRVRRTLAYCLLSAAIILVFTAIGLFIKQLHDLANFDRAVKESIVQTIDNQRDKFKNSESSLTDSVIHEEFDKLRTAVKKDLDDYIKQDKDKITKNTILNVVSRFTFLIISLYVAQIIIKLYRYNMHIADFYTSCDDALELSKDIDSGQRRVLESLIQSLNPDKIKIENAPSPNFLSIFENLKK
jgi:hypothetical protein